MFLLRNVTLNDLDDIYELSNIVSFINLPPDKEIIKKKIQSSIKSFRSPYKDFSKNHYIFVLEDLNKNKFDFGTYFTEGYVIYQSKCECPKGAMCDPCMPPHIIIASMDTPLNETGPEKRITAFVEDPSVFAKGQKYKFLVHILDVKTTNEILNNVDLVYSEPISNP